MDIDSIYFVKNCRCKRISLSLNLEMFDLEIYTGIWHNQFTGRIKHCRVLHTHLDYEIAPLF